MTDTAQLRDRLQGCYVTVPTLFRDDDELSVDLDAMRKHVGFLIDGGITTGNGVLLACGAAGDFSTMTFDERVAVTAAVVEEAAGRVPVVMGGQTTSTKELVRLARAAADIGAEFMQVSPPFYFAHTDDDFMEHVAAAAAASDVGMVVYNTHWTSLEISNTLIDRLAGLGTVVGLKWSMPDNGFMEFEGVVADYSDRFTIIDNQLRFPTSHMLGARGIEVHICNFWPQWGVRMWEMLNEGRYVEAQHELVKVVLPFMRLWTEMEGYTSGDGHLDKLCMELVGLPSSRNRPPTRDIRDLYRDQAPGHAPVHRHPQPPNHRLTASQPAPTPAPGEVSGWFCGVGTQNSPQDLRPATSAPTGALAIIAKGLDSEVMTTMNVSIPDDLKNFVDSRVDNGNYASTSEYVRDLIRRDHDRRQLRAALLEGARSAVVGNADAAYFAALRDRAQTDT